MVTIEKKIPNGKLLRISLKADDKKIKHIKITGDFFAIPPEPIIELEEELKDTPISKKEYIPIIENKLKKTQLIGISIKNIIETIEEALSKEEKEKAHKDN
ncbi:MAG: hypothetical protein GWP09_00070 [Nitrospiraceae bacterium]|nr:hypothetical protein [Nitrospiraceae bacterium]